MIGHAQAKAIRDKELEKSGVHYAWIITHKWKMDDDAWDGGSTHFPGEWVLLNEPIMGPSGVTDQELLLAGTGTEFRLDYDGDGPALKGRLWASDAPDDASGSEWAFAPQDDYGEGGYGTVSILFKTADGNWEML